MSAVAHAHATTLHGANNSGSAGGLLLVQRSTSYCLDNPWSDTVRVQGPTGARRVKGGVSSPAKDFLPVSEVEAGVNFRPAGARGQVVFPGGNQALVPGRSREVWSHLPSTQRFLVSNSCHLDTDWTSGGWTKVCGTTRSGIWVLKSDARARMLPENLDHFLGRMDLSGNIRDRLGYARARLSVFIQVWTWSSSQTTN